MEQTKTPKRSIAASAELKAKLAEMWNVTPRMVNKALLEWSDSRLAHVIRRTAMEHGAVVMVSALEVTMQTGRCVVTHYNKVVKEVEILTLEELDALQQEVAALK